MASEIHAQTLETALRERLGAQHIDMEDTSGGCGQSFQLSHIVSEAFQGKKLLERHRLIHDALKEELKHIHAFSIKRTWTPDEFEKQKHS